MAFGIGVPGQYQHVNSYADSIGLRVGCVPTSFACFVQGLHLYVIPPPWNVYNYNANCIYFRLIWEELQPRQRKVLNKE